MRKALLIGGTGFVGAALARRLAAHDYYVCVPTRRPERGKALRVLPTVEVCEADVHDEKTLAHLCHGQDVVVNLVGILRGDFARVHEALPGKIGQAAAEAKVARLLHVSALGAAKDGRSAYQRSKAAGEEALRRAYPAATIFRPSVIFGRGDSFLTLFARLAKFAPVLPLACPHARFQPVWVEDVAKAMTMALSHPESRGQTYSLCGPKRYSLRELVALACRYARRRRPIIGLPYALAYVQALTMELLGGPLTRDNLLSMQSDNVCKDDETLPFGLSPTPLEAIAPAYLAEV
ncbi:MAG: complex I NDUFA9 subunit family protein [Rhodocyclaceae bacterium]|nr:complex I NDUFA9 subunit family protein [Rhodocyclaceae bacterium]